MSEITRYGENENGDLEHKLSGHFVLYSEHESLLQGALITQRKALTSESDKLIDELKSVRESMRKFIESAENTLHEVAAHYYTHQDSIRCRGMAEETLKLLPKA